MKKFIIYILAFISMSCVNPFQQEKSKTNGVHIHLELNGTRTILPNYTGDILYEISFEGDYSIDPIEGSVSDYDVTMEDGDWVITVKALSESGGVMGQGSVTINVPTTKSVNLDINPSQNITGGISLTLESELPAGITLSRVTAKLTDVFSSNIIELDVTESTFFNISGSSIPSTSYLLVITMFNENDVELNPFTEVVQIFDSQTTSKNILLAQDHFTALPIAPTSIKYTDTIDGVVIGWSCSATNETGFKIQRSDNGGDFNLIDTIYAYNLTSYTDDTVVDNNTYLYRVCAFNNFGESEYLTASSGVTVSSEVDTLYVKPGGAGSGFSWDDALGNPQDALDLAKTYTRKPQVWVAEGTYHPLSQPKIIDEADVRYNHFTIYPGLKIYGGFVGTETLLSQRDPWRNQTILSGDLNGDDVITEIDDYDFTITNNDENVYHTVYQPMAFYGGNAETLLDGFTISGGNANGTSGQDCGGGIYAYSNSTNIKNCLIKGNSSQLAGGGLWYSFSNSYTYREILFDKNVFTMNLSPIGAGIRGSGSWSHITNSIFFKNRSSDSGGAIYIRSGSEWVVRNNLFIGNYALTKGASIYDSWGSDYILANNIFRNNIINNLSEQTNQIYIISRWGGNIYNNYWDTEDSFVNNDPSVNKENYTLTSGLLFNDESNPKGEDDIWFTSDDGFILDSTSRCVDFGNSYDFTIPYNETDALGQNRIKGNTLDLGPYESDGIDSLAPGAITNLEYKKFNGAIELNWDNPIDSDFARTHISWNNGANEIVLDNLSNSTLITDLSISTPIEFEITTRDFAGNISPEEQLIVTLDPLEIPNMNVSGIIGDEQFVIKWDNPTEFLYENIRITWSPTDGLTEPVLCDPDLDSINITGLTNGVTYDFKIETIDYNGNSSEGFTLQVVPGKRIYVNASAPNTGAGSSWDKATNNLSLALDNATPGMEVWVAQGVYIPNSNPTGIAPNGHLSDHFTVTEQVHLLGGFKGDETEASMRKPWVYKTILSGDRNGDDIIKGSGSTLSINNRRDNVYHVLKISKVEATGIVIDGFSITGGNASVVYSERNGGGVYISNKDIKFSNNHIYGNFAGYGGGIYASKLNEPLQNLVIEKNLSEYAGAGAYVSSTGIANSIISDNRAYRGGGGVYWYDDKGVSIQNCLITNNKASADGSGISSPNWDVTKRPLFLNIENSIIWGNYYGDNMERQIYINYIEELVIKNSIINNPLDSIYVEDTTIMTIENLYESFNMVNSLNGVGDDGRWGTEDDGFQTTTLELGVDLGSTTNLVADSCDLDNDGDFTESISKSINQVDRVAGGTIDIGPYEQTEADVFATTDVFNFKYSVEGSTYNLSWIDPPENDLKKIHISWRGSDSSTGSLAIDPGLESVSMENMDINLSYSFYIWTEDFVGNISKGVTYSSTLSGLLFKLNVPIDEQITMGYESNITLSTLDEIYIEVLELFDSYRWYLDGVELSINDYFLTLKGRDFSYGTHILMCVIEKDGHFYSKNLTIVVSNN